jgi:hypothetical protein
MDCIKDLQGAIGTLLTFRQAASFPDQRAQQEVADLKRRVDEVEARERTIATRISTLESDIADLKAQQPALRTLLNNTSSISRNGNTTVIAAGSYKHTFRDDGIFAIVSPRNDNCFASNSSVFKSSC